MTLPGITSEIDLVPSEFFLSQNYPNPFSQKTTIKLCVAYTTYVKLEVSASKAGSVIILMEEEKEAGTYEVQFDAGQLASGVYLCRMTAGEYTEYRKMVLMR